MWSIVSSMKLLRKPSKRGEGDIERNKGSTASLKDHSKEVNITHLDSDAQVNLDPSCSTVGGASGNLTLNGNIGKSATLGSTGAGSSGGTKAKVERRESARLASSATKFLRSLRSHSGSGKIVASSVIAADDKHPINVIALKELDTEAHSLNPGAAGSTAGSSRGGGGGSSSGKLPERSQSFNEKRLLVVTQNTSSENSGPTGKHSGQVKVKHSRAQSFVCNNSSNRNKSGYSIYLNHHQQQYQSNQQNQANIVKQQLLFDQKHKKSTPGASIDVSGSVKSSVQNSLKAGENSSRNKTDTNARSVKSPDTSSSSSTTSPSPRGLNLQSRETIYENLEVILEEKQNQEHMTNKSNIPCSKDYKLGTIGVPTSTSSKVASDSNISDKRTEQGGSEDNTIERCSEGGSSSKGTTTASSSSESLEVNMKISGKERPSQVTRRYNKDSGYETSCSDYSNIVLPKSSSVDSIINSRMTMDHQKSHPGSPAGVTNEHRSNRILNTSLYDELNISSIREDIPSAKPQNSRGLGTPTGGGRKLRRSISEVPAERNTNLAKLQTKVGDSTARAMYTIANGLAVWTTDEKSSSSLGLNSGGNNSGSSQGLHQYQSVYGCRPHLQLLQPQSVPGGFSAAIQQASVYSTLPRNHTTNSTTDSFGGVYRAFQYRNTHVQLVSSQQSQSASQPYHNYHQIAAKSTPSLRNEVLQEHQLQKKCFGEPSVDEKQLSSSSTSTSAGKTSRPRTEPQQQPIYQTLPIPTLSPARSTPNLGSTGTNKLVQPRPIQQQRAQGSIPHLSIVSSSQQQVNDLGKTYPKTQQSHQKLYLHSGSSTCLSQQSISSSVLQLQSTNENAFAEPGRYPSTPNLQKCDSSNILSAANPQNDAGFTDQCNLSEGHNGDPNRNTTGSTNSGNIDCGAMSSSNESVAPTNWNSIDAQSILNNNNSAPARDPSSLKQIRYGPGHEKYPSWPIPVSSAQQIDPAGESHPVKLIPGSGSTRSKSWTDQTDYPKEKTPSYARPYMKRANHSYTQQLKTVMEKCERLPPDAFASQKDSQQLLHSHGISHSSGNRNIAHHPHSGVSKGNDGSIVPPPLLYRDLMCSQQNGHGNPNVGYNNHHHNLLHYYHPSQHPGQQHQMGSNSNSGMCEKDYMIPSPERNIPEKEHTVSKPLTQEDLELYTKKYEELMTQYPQSEGYHSYISSDSSSYISSGTPFLDQLRRESENNQQFWSGDKSINPNGGVCDPNDPLFGLVGGQLAAAVSGRESVTTVVTNSSSNSSGTETLKWHGSTSDISLASGIGGSMHSGANTALATSLKPNHGSGHNNNSSSPRKGVSPPITTSTSAPMLNKGWGEQKNIANSARLSTPQKQLAANPDAMCSQNSQLNGGGTNLRSQLEQQNGSPSLSKWHSGSGELMDHQCNNKNSSNNGKNNGNPGISSSHPNLKKFPLNTYTRPSMLAVDKSNSSQTSSSSNHSGNSSSATSTPEKMAKLLQSLNTETVNAMNLKGAKSLSHSLSSPVIDTSKPPSVAERILELEQQSHQQQNSASPSTSGTSSPKMSHNQHHSNEHLAFIASSFMKSSSLNNLPNSPVGLYPEESSGQSQQQNDWLQGNRANTASPRGFTQSLSTSTVNKVAADPSNNNTNMTYSYLDPDKKHKVADMTLKAIQKKALLSYYERHKGKCANTSSASSVSSSDGNSSQADGLSLEKDLCFPGKSNRLMLSLPKEQSVSSIDQHLSHQNSNILAEESRNGNSGSSVSNNNTLSNSSPTLAGISRNYRAISTSSSGVSSSSSSSSRSSGASNYKLSSQSLQHHHQLVHAANNSNSSQKSLQSAESIKQVEKSENKQSLTNSSTPDGDPADGYLGSDSARLAYMSKYLPHLVNRDSNTSPPSTWSNGSSAKLPPGGSGSSNGATTVVTQEPAPIPPERPPKKPHLRNLAQQVHEENKDTKPPPPLPRAPVRPPALLNNGTTGKSGGTGPPPIPSKPGASATSGGIGMTRSPSPDELPPPPPPPPTEEMEVLVNDEPLPPPPTVSEVDVIFGSRSRSVTGLSSCLHKDSYMAQRKERTLGYEGRYRRTLSPSGLGSNNSSKSSLDSASPGASDSLGSGRTTASNVGTGKLDSTLSPSAWEKFHNIRPPSTTVIFTSNELSKGVASPTSSSTPSTSGSPQPPSAQTLFPRSISCDSNIFNNKTGASQSSIPPPVAQVAPLRGSNASNNSDAVESFPEKSHHASLRANVIPLAPTNMSSQTAKQCDNDSCSPDLPTGDTMNGIFASDNICEKGERGFRDMYEKRTNGVDHPKQETNISRSTSITFSNSVLPSVIVPPLQYEKYEKDGRSGGQSLNQNYSSESNLSMMKKSEFNLRVNCNSIVDLQSDVINGNGELESNNSKGSSPYPMSNEPAGNTIQCNADGYATNKGNGSSSGIQTFNSTASFYTGRQKTQEELECEELSRDIAKLLPQGDKLQTLLVPLPDHKTTADYMEGLFHLELKLQPETTERRGSQTISTGLIPDKEGNQEETNEVLKSTSSVTVEEAAINQKTATTIDVEITKNESAGTSLPELNGNLSHNSNGNPNSDSDRAHLPLPTPPQGVPDRSEPEVARVIESSKKMQSNNTIQTSYRRCNGHAPLPADSAYFTTSESKAKFLTQYNNDIKKEPNDTVGEELDKQKEELVSRISRKLEILRTEQLLLREEIQSNEQLGQMVVERVKQTAKRNEFDKFKLHVEEIEKITSLLLGISGRLARAENALMGLSEPPNPQEKKILESKRDKLREQLDEAKILKENIDRRSAQVSSFLQKYLTVEEYADYDHFVKMKAKLIIDAREIDDKIKLGEEQLGALKDALSATLPFSPNSSSS